MRSTVPITHLKYHCPYPETEVAGDQVVHGDPKPEIEDYTNKKSPHLQGQGKQLPQPTLERPSHKEGSEAPAPQ
jgi:hypothetical protein